MPFSVAHSTAVIMIDISLALLHSKTANIEGLGITVVNVLLLDGSCSHYLSPCQYSIGAGLDIISGRL